LLNPPFWTNPSWFIALLQFYRSWINFWLPIVSNLGWKIYWWMVNSHRTLGLWCGFLVRRTDCWWSCRCCQWPQHGGKPQYLMVIESSLWTNYWFLRLNQAKWI
jgi:hypothetical protein